MSAKSGSWFDRLLRNNWFKYLSGCAVDEREAKRLCPAPQMAKDSAPLGSGVLVSAGVAIDEVALQDPVDEDGELPCRGGNRLRLADAGGEPPVERAEAVCVRPRLIAAMRNIAAARLADDWVRAERSRPPEMLFLGASVNHDVKCFSVGQRCISVPISASSLSAVTGAMPSICVRSTPPVRWCNDARTSNDTS